VIRLFTTSLLAFTAVACETVIPPIESTGISDDWEWFEVHQVDAMHTEKTDCSDVLIAAAPIENPNLRQPKQMCLRGFYGPDLPELWVVNTNKGYIDEHFLIIIYSDGTSAHRAIRLEVAWTSIPLDRILNIEIPIFQPFETEMRCYVTATVTVRTTDYIEYHWKRKNTREWWENKDRFQEYVRDSQPQCS